MNTETKVGFFTIIGLALIGVAIFLLGDFSLRKEYRVDVKFKDVAGLPDKANVKLSGVLVGKVKAIAVDGDEVIVTVAIDKKVKIYRNAVFKVGSTSVIGSKFLQVDQGTASSGLLADGDVVRGTDVPPLDKMLTETLISLKTLIDDVAAKGQLAEQLNATLVNVRNLTANLNDLVATMSPHMQGTMQNVEQLTQKLDGLLVKADTLMANINSGKGTVGALVNDPVMKDDIKQTMNNVKEASASAKKMLNRMGGFSVEWRYEGLYEPQAMATRSNFGMKIAPRPGRYYYLGVSNIGNKDDAPRGPDYVDKNQIDLRLGWEDDMYDLYFGILHGSGGLGVKFVPFYKDPLWGKVGFIAEGYDFQRNRVIKGKAFNTPNYRAAAEVKFTKNIAAQVGVTDILGTGNMQYGAVVSFDDKDIAYLLGLVSLGAVKSTGGN